ncbi:MAG: hypothetical protein JWP97_387 [Labilithrix sp.]|nr:hypothetical protein [Labilithrix sp.]
MTTTAHERLVFGLVASPAPGADASGPFDALADWLRAHAGVDLERRNAADYKELMGSVRDGSTDVAWLPPVAYAWVAEGVTPIGSIVRRGRTSYSAALVTLAGSRVTALEATQLAGARAGWVDPWSAAGYVVPRLELLKAGIDPATAFASETFHGTHRDTMLALKSGACDVAATFARTPEDGAAVLEGAWSLVDGLDVRVLGTYGPIPTDVIAVRRNLLPASYERIVAALRAACADAAEGQALARAVFGGDELREGVGKGHEGLRHVVETAVANGVFD